MRNTRTRKQIKYDLETQSKICGSCNERKSFNEYYNDKKTPDKKQTKCIRCEQLYCQEHKEKIRQHKKTHYASYKKIHRELSLKRRYNMNQEDYDKMFFNQGGKCKICGTEDTSENRYFHIDHDHETGEVRGLLCKHCNIGLGHFKDSIALLIKAVDYLGKGD